MTQFDTALSLCKRLKEAGFEAYFAGGWVRDFVMGHPSSDIDIATSATAAEMQALFPHTIPVGIAFESLVVVEDGQHYELSSFRQDLEYSNGRTPDAIAPATAEEDAQRRDFTINGMFYDPLEQQIFDFVGGRQDIEAGLVRAIGDAQERFREDRLRMIRGVRMAARFAFELEARTEAAIRAQAHRLYPAVAVERVWAELQKMHAYPRFDHALRELFRLGLLQVIFPSLEGLSLEVIEARLESFEKLPPRATVLLHILHLFPDDSMEETEALCRSLKMSKASLKEALLYRQAQTLLARQQRQKGEVVERIDWARYMAEDEELLCLQSALAYLPLGQRDALWDDLCRLKRSLHEPIRRLQAKRPLVTAVMLVQAGVAKGPLLGALLREAERLAVNEELEEATAVMERLRDTPLWRTLDA
jgi:poly(A) polymerase